MGWKLYEIDERQQDLVEGSVNEETGEITFNEEEIEALAIERNEIMEGLCLASKNDEAMETALREEAKKLEDRADKLKKRRDSRNEFIKHKLNGYKLSTPRVQVSYRTTHDVVKFAIPEKSFKEFAVKENLLQYLTEKNDYTVSKTKIKEAIKAGQEVPYATLEDSVSMTIK